MLEMMQIELLLCSKLSNYQKEDRGFQYEIIIVDDGSTDKTTEVGVTCTNLYIS